MDVSKCTKGPATAVCDRDGDWGVEAPNRYGDGTDTIVDLWYLDEETHSRLHTGHQEEDVVEHNAALIAEAFNVATETGLSPRQLAEYYYAIRDRHNGYDPAMKEIPTPETPKQALDELLTEADSFGPADTPYRRMQQLKEQRDKLQYALRLMYCLDWGTDEDLESLGFTKPIDRQLISKVAETRARAALAKIEKGK
jgi:hypothetical protein